MTSSESLWTSQPEIPARAFLRDATRPAHEHLERLAPLQSDHLTLDEYVTTLRRFRGIYEVLEARIASHAPVLARLGLDWTKRRKLPLLERDLIVLAAVAPEPLAPARVEAAPALVTLDDVMGCMYVIEGATLGGTIIRRNVERVLHLTPDRGVAFFASYGGDVGAYWKEFCASLERVLVGASARSHAAFAATATFRFFADNLSTQGV